MCVQTGCLFVCVCVLVYLCERHWERETERVMEFVSEREIERVRVRVSTRECPAFDLPVVSPIHRVGSGVCVSVCLSV